MWRLYHMFSLYFLLLCELLAFGRAFYTEIEPLV
jgi:hypothetical protein